MRQLDPSSHRRILALDLGRARIGVAITDALGLTAQPLLTIYRKTAHADIKSIGRIVRKHGVAEIVVGLPLHLFGDAGPQAERAQKFTQQLQSAFNLPVHLWDERLTTHAARELLDEADHARGGKIAKARTAHTAKDRGIHDRIRRKKIIDQVAAVLILECFLAARATGAAHGAGA